MARLHLQGSKSRVMVQTALLPPFLSMTVDESEVVKGGLNTASLLFLRKFNVQLHPLDL